MQEVSALKIQILVFDALKEQDSEDGKEGEDGLQNALQMRQQSIREEAAANHQASAGLQQMVKGLEVALLSSKSFVDSW